MVNQKIAELLYQYFELGVAEGSEGRTHDAAAGDAQRVLSEIEAEMAALSSQNIVSRLGRRIHNQRARLRYWEELFNQHVHGHLNVLHPRHLKKAIELGNENFRLRQLLSEAEKREREARAKALEDLRELLQFTKWSASVYHCPPPRSKRDNPLKHSSIIRLHGSFDTKAEALSAALAAIKSGWAGTTIIHRESAKPLAQFNIQNGVADAIGRLAFAESALQSEER